jgi:hypothetical protein
MRQDRWLESKKYLILDGASRDLSLHSAMRIGSPVTRGSFDVEFSKVSVGRHFLYKRNGSDFQYQPTSS